MILLESVTLGAALPRFNQRYYADLPFLSSFLAALWWMCCYWMMYVYRLRRITAVLKSYSFPSHITGKCLYAEIIQGFQVCLSISPSVTYDKCLFVKNSKLCSQTFLYKAVWMSAITTFESASGKWFTYSFYFSLRLAAVVLHCHQNHCYGGQTCRHFSFRVTDIVIPSKSLPSQHDL